MRFLPLAALLLIAAAPAKQSTTKSPPKRNSAAHTHKKAPPTFGSMKKLVEIALKKGEDATLPDPRATKFGLPGPQPTRDYIVGDLSKDTQLSGDVILGGEGKEPSGVVLSSTTVTEWSGEDPVAIEGWLFRADLDGNLIAAMHTHGKVGDVIQDVEELSPSTKSRFEALKKRILTMPIDGATK